MEPRFNKPLYNEVHGTRNNFLQPGQNYSKMHGTGTQFDEILVTMNTIYKRKSKIYLDNYNE